MNDTSKTYDKAHAELWAYRVSKGDNLRIISQHREREAAAVIRFGDMIAADIAVTR